MKGPRTRSRRGPAAPGETPLADLTNQGLSAVDNLSRVRCAFQRTNLEVVRHKARRTLLVARYLWRIR
jgi:hypothetical protein